MASHTTMQNQAAPEKAIDLNAHLRWPFQSPLYDPEVVNGSRTQQFVEKLITYGGQETFDYFEVAKGKGTLRKQTTLREIQLDPSREGPEIRIFILGYEKDTLSLNVKRHFYIPLRKNLFIELLEKAAIPPTFVDIHADNNGAYTAYPITPVTSRHPETFRLFVKLANTVTTWCTLYYAYDVETANSTFLILGRHAECYQSRLQQLYCDSFPARAQRDPFVVIAAMVAEMSALFEEERRLRDREVQAEESKTGFAALRVHYSSGLQNLTMGSTRNLHTVAGHLQFLKRAVNFQIGLIEFLIMQHEKLTEMRKSRSLKSLDDLAAIEGSAEKTQRSLHLTLSSTRHRLNQVVELTYRIAAQIKVVDNMIAQGDSRANIAIAEQSRRIAIDTKEDSVAMKTISALTMVFLPGTFVGTIFGMVFFSFDQDGNRAVRVSPLWWLYLAITIPLTVLVLALWTLWMRWTMRSTVLPPPPSKAGSFAQDGLRPVGDSRLRTPQVEEVELLEGRDIEDFGIVDDQHVY